VEEEREVQDMEPEGAKVRNCVPNYPERACDQSPVRGWPQAEAYNLSVSHGSHGGMGNGGRRRVST
jgi:hypothetical protein